MPAALCRFSKATDTVATIHLADASQSTNKAFAPVQGVVTESSQKFVKIVLSVQAADSLLGAYLKDSATSTPASETNYSDSAADSVDFTDSDAESDEEGRSMARRIRKNGRILSLRASTVCGVRLDMFSKSVVAERQLECLKTLGDVQDPSNEAEVCIHTNLQPGKQLSSILEISFQRQSIPHSIHLKSDILHELSSSQCLEYSA